MNISVCPRCGSKNIYQGTIRDGVLTGYTTRYVCKDCGYQGMPIIFDSEKEYKKFLTGISRGKGPIDKIEKEKMRKEAKTFKYERPFGVTILAFIMIFDGIFAIYLYYLVASLHMNIWPWTYYIIVLLISAIVLPYGFLKGKGWAWTFGGILYVFSLPIGLIFLYYLTRPHVKVYFGKT